MNIKISKKLNSLGGIKKRIEDNKDGLEKAFLEIETIFESKLPDFYKDMQREFGGFSFKNSIKIKCLDSHPFVSIRNEVSVGDFYRIEGKTEYSTNFVLETFNELLPKGLLPICDGELGDLICLSLRKVDFEYVYYIHHESPPDNSLILLARNFEEFIMKLEIYKYEASENDLVKKMKVQVTPQFLELLKKSGYGPKT